MRFTRCYSVFLSEFSAQMQALRSEIVSNTKLLDFVASATSMLKKLQVLVKILFSLFDLDSTLEQSATQSLGKSKVLLEVLFQFNLDNVDDSLQQLFFKSFNPFLEIVSIWITTGNVVDYHGEVFAGAFSKEWNAPMHLEIPFFLQHLESKIINCGKSVCLYLSLHESPISWNANTFWDVSTSSAPGMDFFHAFHLSFEKSKTHSFRPQYASTLVLSFELPFLAYYSKLSSQLISHCVFGWRKEGNQILKIEEPEKSEVVVAVQNGELFQPIGSGLMKHLTLLRAFFFSGSADLLEPFITNLFKKVFSISMFIFN